MIQQIISDHILCAKYCVGQWESNSEQSQLRSRPSQSLSCLTALTGQVGMSKYTGSTFQKTLIDLMLGTQYTFLSKTIIVFLASLKIFTNNISSVDLCYHYFNCISIVVMVKLFGVLNWNVSNQGTFLTFCSAAVTLLKLELAILVLVGTMEKAGIWSFRHRHSIVRDSQVPVDINHCVVPKSGN